MSSRCHRSSVTLITRHRSLITADTVTITDHKYIHTKESAVLQQKCNLPPHSKADDRRWKSHRSANTSAQVVVFWLVLAHSHGSDDFADTWCHPQEMPVHSIYYFLALLDVTFVLATRPITVPPRCLWLGSTDQMISLANIFCDWRHRSSLQMAELMWYYLFG
jgi:hypothetical protein